MHVYHLLSTSSNPNQLSIVDWILSTYLIAQTGVHVQRDTAHADITRIFFTQGKKTRQRQDRLIPWQWWKCGTRFKYNFQIIVVCSISGGIAACISLMTSQHCVGYGLVAWRLQTPCRLYIDPSTKVYKTPVGLFATRSICVKMYYTAYLKGRFSSMPTRL